MHYTDRQIQDASQKYLERTDPVMGILRLAPLNERGIYIVNHASNNFLITSIVEQGLGCGRIKTEVLHCRELYLATNPGFPRNKSLVDKFADSPLRIEQSPPFFFVAYDTPTFDYVIRNARTEQEFERGRIMRTENDVPFYLTREVSVNAVLPFRICLGDKPIAVKRK